MKMIDGAKVVNSSAVKSTRAKKAGSSGEAPDAKDRGDRLELSWEERCGKVVLKGYDWVMGGLTPTAKDPDIHRPKLTGPDLDRPSAAQQKYRKMHK